MASSGFVEAPSHDSGRIAGGDRVRRNVAGHDGLCRDDCAIADRDPGENRASGSQPYVVADNDVAPCSAEVGNARRFVREFRKRIGTYPVDAVVTAEQDFYPVCDRAVGADPEGAAFFPVMHFGHAVGSDAELVIGISRAELCLSTQQLGQVPATTPFRAALPPRVKKLHHRFHLSPDDFVSGALRSPGLSQ